MRNHPECRSDEIHIGNCRRSIEFSWRTQRLGLVAYREDVLPSRVFVEGMFPVFVKRSEIVKIGIASHGSLRIMFQKMLEEGQP